MTAGLAITLLLFAAFASSSARYIDRGFNKDVLSDSTYSALEFDDVEGINADCLNFENSVPVANQVITNVGIPVISSPAAILQAKATADAIAEIAAAKTVRAKAAAQAKMNALRMAATKLNVQKTHAEAELRSRSAEIHAAKAKAAAERRMYAMAEEQAELFAARQDQILVEQLRKAAAQALIISEEESIQSEEMIYELEREAAAHDARAAAARAKADAAAAAAGLPSLTVSAGLSSVSTSSEYSFASDNTEDSSDLFDLPRLYNSDQFDNCSYDVDCSGSTCSSCSW